MKKLYASTVMKNEHTTGTIKYYQILDEKSWNKNSKTNEELRTRINTNRKYNR